MPFRVLVLLVGLLVSILAGEADRRWAIDRETVRKARAELRLALAKDEAQRGREAASELGALVDRLGPATSATAASQVLVLVKGLQRFDPAASATLAARVAAIPRTASDARSGLADIQRARSRILKPLEDTAQRALRAKVPDFAYRYMRHVQAYWPEHPELHRNLGLTRLGERWLGPRDLVRAKAGLVWDDSLGWILAREQARYAQGDYYDLQARRWTTLAEADKTHGSLENPWVFETEHLAVSGTAPMRVLAATAGKLEAFYAQIFAAYSRFFGNDPDDIRLVFGLLPHEPLKIHIAADKARYQAAVQAAGADPGWSAGMWISRTGSSFFIAGIDSTTYHEFTHQILSVFTGRCRAPSWLVESVAQYTEAPAWIDGELVLGRLERNRDLLAHLRAAKAGSQLDVEALLRISDGATWSAAADPQPQYRAAAALAWWCMEAEGRRYRDDYIDFLRDSYRGEEDGRGLWDYLGLGRAQFLAAYRAWEAAAAAERPLK